MKRLIFLPNVFFWLWKLSAKNNFWKRTQILSSDRLGSHWMKCGFETREKCSIVFGFLFSTENVCLHQFFRFSRRDCCCSWELHFKSELLAKKSATFRRITRWIANCESRIEFENRDAKTQTGQTPVNIKFKARCSMIHWGATQSEQVWCHHC